jgi:hypothetical protein
MFERFEASFVKDSRATAAQEELPADNRHPPELRQLLLRFGGASFDRGLYRVMAADIRAFANGFIAEAFVEFSSRVLPFAYDWLGRIFALDTARLESGEAGVVMFEPGTGEALEIPCNLLTFHENELIEQGEAALAMGLHAQWLAGGAPPPKQHQCVGYKLPLFLGGNDTVENLDIRNLDVYWSGTSQLIRQTRDLPPGTEIRIVGGS